MEFRKVVRDIRDLKIQGAENIAKEAALSLRHVIHRTKARNARELYLDLVEARRLLEDARPTEPCMRNALNFILSKVNKNDPKVLVAEIEQKIQQVLQYFHDAEKKIAEIGASRIPNGGTVFTHCHSSTVMMILAKAKFDGKAFEVHNTETRPRFQGRTTAKELSALGIPVTHYVDSAARLALKNTDIFLFGADAIQSEGRIVNKIGTELLLEIAHKYDIPSYCCSVSWKFDPHTIFGSDEPMENRHRSEVWPDAPPKVKIMNPAFEIVDPMLVTGVISEVGVYKPTSFVDEVRRTQKWMF
jgi:ribose 1,5-bisphosphate isomerase